MVERRKGRRPEVSVLVVVMVVVPVRRCGVSPAEPELEGKVEWVLDRR